MIDKDYLKLSSTARVREAKEVLERAKSMNKKVKIVPKGFTFNKINNKK